MNTGILQGLEFNVMSSLTHVMVKDTWNESVMTENI